jgi:hypothetical protein
MSSLLERKEFLDLSLLYLFTCDIELDPKEQERLGHFAEGVRMNCFSRGDLSRVYNVGREATVPGSGVRSISGKIIWGGDEILLRNDDVASCDIRVAVQTDDDATIHVSYEVVGYMGPGGVARVIEGTGDDRLGTEDHPFEAPLVTSPRFQTGSAQYAWLNAVQGIGFGRAQLIRSRFRRLTYDVYALT